MSPFYLEAVSWRLAAEMKRRHPEAFKFILMHPGGGTYNCLSFMRENEHLACLNRGGSFTVFNTPFSRSGQIPSERLWDRAQIREGMPLELLNEMSDMLGLTVPKKRPPTTPETLTYRVIADFLYSVLPGKHLWRCENLFLDTSGYGAGVQESLLERFPTARDNLRVRHPDDVLDQPSYRFWFVMREEKPVLCLESTGLAHTKEGQQVELMPLYKPTRQVWAVIYPLLHRYLL